MKRYVKTIEWREIIMRLIVTQPAEYRWRWMSLMVAGCVKCACLRDCQPFIIPQLLWSLDLSFQRIKGLTLNHKSSRNLSFKYIIFSTMMMIKIALWTWGIRSLIMSWDMIFPIFCVFCLNLNLFIFQCMWLHTFWRDRFERISAHERINPSINATDWAEVKYPNFHWYAYCIKMINILQNALNMHAFVWMETRTHAVPSHFRSYSSSFIFSMCMRICAPISPTERL